MRDGEGRRVDGDERGGTVRGVTEREGTETLEGRRGRVGAERGGTVMEAQRRRAVRGGTETQN